VIPNRVWVGGLPSDITERQLQDLFSECGRVEEIYIKHGKVDTFAFITMGDDDAYQRALDELDCCKDLGKEIRVNVVLDHGQDGGGKGGKDGFVDARRGRSPEIRRPAKGWKKGGGSRGYDDRDSYRDHRDYRRDDSRSRRGSYRQAPRRQESPPKQVWVGGLPDDIEERELREQFSKCGPVLDVIIRTVRNSGDTIAFIGFESLRDAERAAEDFNQSDCFGPVVTCDLARGRPGAKGESRGESHRVNGSSHRSSEGRGYRDDRRARSRSRSAIPRQRKGGGKGGKGRAQHIVNLENLPDDMDDNELFSMASEYGEIVSMDLWDDDKCKAGQVEYETRAACDDAIESLHDRRVDGWDMKLKAYMEKRA